jgi:hypothetical protein
MPNDAPSKPVLKALAAPRSVEKPKDHLTHVRLDAKLQAARYVDEAVRVLVDTMRNADNEKLRKEAALDIIQMVLGKPSKPADEPKDAKPQVIDVDDATLEAILDGENIKKFSDE